MGISNLFSLPVQVMVIDWASFLVLHAIASIPAEHGRERTWHARHTRTYTRTLRLEYPDGALTPNTYAEGTGPPISGGRTKDRGCCTPTEGTCCLHDRSGRWQSWLGHHVARGRVGQMALGRPYRSGRGRFSYHDEHLNNAREEIFPGRNSVLEHDNISTIYDARSCSV